MANKNLTKAKSAKNDEFYTLYKDIEKELIHYKDQLKDKIIYCNCDTIESNFVKYFTDNFEELGIKKLLHSSCDFRSDESVDLLKECDVVITNPPFSLFREYVAQLVEYDKKFLIIGNMNAITYKEMFTLIKNNQLWLGCSPRSMNFILPDKSIINVHAVWYTDLKVLKRNQLLTLTKLYNEVDYPKYDNYDAINVDKVKDIPCDYEGVIGVPITYLDKYDPEQFEIIDCNSVKSNPQVPSKSHGLVKDREGKIGNRICYARILIKRTLNN